MHVLQVLLLPHLCRFSDLDQRCESPATLIFQEMISSNDEIEAVLRIQGMDSKTAVAAEFLA